MKKTDRQKYLTEEEYQKLLSVIKDGRDYMLFKMTGDLGLRVGETIRLRRQDFNFSAGYIHCPTLKQDKERKENEPKGFKIKGSIKRGELPQTYKDIAVDEDLLQQVQKYMELYRIKTWLFPHDDGVHIPKFTAQRLFKSYVKKAKLDPVYSVHSLRHYRGFTAFNSLNDIRLVQALLRHKSISSTQVYTEVTVDKMKEALQKIKQSKKQ